MRCPRDGTELVSGENGGVAFATCPACRGTWASLNAGSEQADQIRKLPDKASLVSRRHQHHEPAECPLHPGELMMQRYLQGIQLDVCPQCDGLWLDPGEYRYLSAWAQKSRNQNPSRGESGITALDGGSIAAEVAGEGALSLLSGGVEAAGTAVEVAGHAGSFVVELLGELLGGL